MQMWVRGRHFAVAGVRTDGKGCLYSVEWNRGMTTPVERSVPDYLYPISGVYSAKVLESFRVSRRRLAQGDWLNAFNTPVRI